MRVNNVTLAKVGTKLSQFPQEDEYLPEFAFVGKSNVGKSSLINSMGYDRGKLKQEAQGEDENQNA